MSEPKPERRRRAAPVIMPQDESKLPPHSIESEQGVLGCMLLETKSCIPLACEKLTEDHFYDMRHGCIFSELQKMHEAGKEIDPITFQQCLRDGNMLEAIGGMPYIAGLMNCVPSASALEHYVAIVHEKYQLRKVLQTCAQTISKVYDSQSDAEGLIDEFGREAQAVSDDKHTEAIKPIKGLVHGAISEIEARHEAKGKPRGISTGFPDLDRMTSGLQNAEMIVIAARPSMGKTSFVMNMVEHVALVEKISVGVFSLEMTAESLTLRMLCSRARVNLKNIDDGFLAERDFPALTGAAGEISKAPLFIDDSSELGIKQIRGRARRMVQKHGCKMFVIDYFGLIARIGKAGDDRVELGKICVGVKAMAKELNVPVILICQLNRELDKEKKRKPRLSDLRDSGQVEQEADLIGFLYAPDRDETDDEPAHNGAIPVNLLIAKQRNGPTGDVHLTFLKSFTRFESASKVSDVPDETMI